MDKFKINKFQKFKRNSNKMEKNLYIDASHPNETRIVLKSDHSIEEYEFEDKNNLNFKNNIYLATVSRVEPSLQAAFVNFGRERHGFLAFNDIQSDYYQLPSEDKERIRIAEEKIREDLKDKTIDANQVIQYWKIKLIAKMEELMMVKIKLKKKIINMNTEKK